MFSYGTGGLHTLPLHLVRFLWLPALNVCSLIGDWFLLLVPVQSSPSDVLHNTKPALLDTEILDD